MDQYKAPMQYTPSCGLHDRFCVDEEQAKRLGSTTRITYVGTTFAMYVKFKIGLCNCQPSRTEGDGENKFKIAYQLLDIPKLPDELFNLRRRPAPTTQVEQVEQAYGKNTVVQLCTCTTVKEADGYDSLIQLGMVLKNIGAPLDLWEQLIKKRKKYKRDDCSTQWHKCNANNYTIGTLKHLAKKGAAEKYNNFKRVAHSLPDIIDNGHDYPVICIKTPLLTTKKEATAEMDAGQRVFGKTVEILRAGSTKSFALKS